MNLCNKNDWEIYCILKAFNSRKAKEYLSKRKRERKMSCPAENSWSVVTYSDESVLEKRFFEGYFSEDEWNDFVDATELVTNSPYDCTGRWFTIRLDKYETEKGTWVYHCMGLDV